MRSYIGLIHRAAEGGFDVTFPDFPSLVAAGTTLDDARSVAEEALARHIAGVTVDGAGLPAPSTLEQVMSHSNNRNGIAILVAVKSEQSRAVRVNVTMPEDVLAQFDRFAEAHGFTRSGLLTQAAKKLLAAMTDIPPGCAEPQVEWAHADAHCPLALHAVAAS